MADFPSHPVIDVWAVLRDPDIPVEVGQRLLDRRRAVQAGEVPAVCPEGDKPFLNRHIVSSTSPEDHREKPWRVSVSQLVRTDWATQKEALDHADQLQTAGHWVTVRYWNGGQWHRYATLSPTESVADALALTSPDTPGPFRNAPEQLGTENVDAS
ncbi:hypothetical protein [Nonomuraea sp. NPDC050202]|uniref:hypothetical protein n=1 Tax=Nonomuraea sp. NPDC050202 TaxID=3155035 RepID=UPI0033F202E2